jgi:hypothetical protein
MLSSAAFVATTARTAAVAFPSANNWYVRSSAGGTANGADWTNAYLLVNTALNATNTQPGDTIWVSEDHVETQITSGLILSTNNNTVSTPTYIICANHSSGNIPPNMNTDLQTTANVTSRDLTMTISNGAMSFYGITFNAATGNAGGFGAITISPGNQSMQRFINCTFNQVGNNTPTGPALTIGGNSALPCEFIFNNCKFNMTQPLHRMVFNGGYTQFHNSTFNANSTTFIYQAAAVGSFSRTRFKRCNLSNVTATFLYDAGVANATMYDIAFNECQWSANISNLVETPANMSQAPLQMTRTNGLYNSVYFDFWGQSQMSNTIYRVGSPAYDLPSNSHYSQTLTTFNNANTSAVFPATANPIVKWNSDTTDTLTATIYGNANVNANTLTNAQIWIEVEYLANTSPNNVTKIASSGCNGNNPVIYPWNVTAASLMANDTTSTWTGGYANGSFALTTTFKVGQPGIVKCYVKSGIASTNSIAVHIDPVLYLANSTGFYTSNTALTSNTTLTYNTGLAQINESKMGYAQPAIKNVWQVS